MGKELPGVHGADHLPWGADPIPALATLIATATLEWALASGGSYDNVGAGLNDVLWDAIIASNGAGWGIDGTGKLLETGDVTRRYVYIACTRFENTASSAKTIYMDDNPYVDTGTWNVHLGSRDGLFFRYAESMPFTSLGLATLMNVGVFNFAISGAVNGALSYRITEDDTGNPVTLFTTSALVIRLP